MKYGKPVIASDRGALPELVKDGVNGIIFKVNHNECIQQVLKSISLTTLKKMGNKGIYIFHETFQKENMQRISIAIAKDVIEKK